MLRTGALYTRNGADIATANTSGTATDASLTASAGSFTATQGSGFNGVVASFSDAAGGSTTSEFTATIDWGDGSQPTTGSVTARGGGQFDVAGAHTYAQRAPSVPVTVTIVDAGGSRATAKSVAAVADAPLTAWALWALTVCGMGVPFGVAKELSSQLVAQREPSPTLKGSPEVTRSVGLNCHPPTTA